MRQGGVDYVRHGSWGWKTDSCIRAHTPTQPPTVSIQSLRTPNPGDHHQCKVVSFKFDDSWWAGVSIDLGCGEVKGHMHLSTGHGCATLPVPPQAAWNTSMPPGLRPRLGSGLPLPPAQHVFDRLHRQYVTPSGMVDCGQHQHAPGLWPSSR